MQEIRGLDLAWRLVLLTIIFWDCGVLGAFVDRLMGGVEDQPISLKCVLTIPEWIVHMRCLY